MIDSKKFEKIYNNYYKLLYSVAYSYLKNTSDVEEAVQETFLKFLKTKTKFKTDENIKYWLVRVIINYCINQLKNKKRYVTDDEYVMSIPDNSNNNRSEYINSLVERLDIKYRIVIVLFYYENYSIEEISKELKISQSATKMRLKRAKEKISEMEKRNGNG